MIKFLCQFKTLAQLSGPLPNGFKYLYNTKTERGLKAENTLWRLGDFAETRLVQGINAACECLAKSVFTKRRLQAQVIASQSAEGLAMPPSMRVMFKHF